MGTTNPRASVLIVSWNAPDLLARCLASVAESVREVSYEIVVALNEPTPDVVSSIDQSGVDAIVLRSRVNLGFGGAANLAASAASGEFLVFLNDDARVLPGWLETLVETVDRRPEAHAVGSQFLSSDGSLQEAGSIVWSDGSTLGVGRSEGADTRSYGYERRVDYCSAASLLVRRSEWDRHNGFDADTFFPAYYEDADLCFKIAAAGGSVWYQPKSKVIHHQGMSTSSHYKEFLFDRNRSRFVQRWGADLRARLAPSTDPAEVKRAVWMAMGTPTRVLVIDDRFPNAARGSGLARMFDVISDLHSTGRFHVGFAAVSDTTDAGVLDSLGVEVVGDLQEHLDDDSNEWDAILISRPHNFQRWAEIIRARRPHTPLTYDAEALYSKRIDRESTLTTDQDRRDALEQEAWLMRGIEGASVRDADLVVCISEDEADEIRRMTDAPVHVHSPLLRAAHPTAAEYPDRDLAVGFVAGWLAGPQSPNVDALQWFARHVLPVIRARVPGALVRVTGADPPDEVLMLASPAVEFVGGVRDLSAFYNSIRVAVSPMRFGAGVKLKTMEALQHGVPTVATNVGGEGIPLSDPRCLPKIDDAVRFGHVVAMLLSDRRAWEAQRRRLRGEYAGWSATRAETFWPELIDVAMTSRMATTS